MEYPISWNWRQAALPARIASAVVRPRLKRPVMPISFRSTIVLAGLLPALAGAATLHVFIAGAAKAGAERQVPGFEQAGGDRVEAVYDTAGALRDRVLEGERPDL